MAMVNSVLKGLGSMHYNHAHIVINVLFLYLLDGRLIRFYNTPYCIVFSMTVLS